jgi:hypothetical protein
LGGELHAAKQHLASAGLVTHDRASELAWQQRALHAEDLVEKLKLVVHDMQGKFLGSQNDLRMLGDTLTEMSARLRVLEMRAKCAPYYFDVLLTFLNARCVRGAQERVSSKELHMAFSSYIVKKNISPPSQRDLRALLEQLGFEYGQVYVNKNTRGFRGLGLLASMHKEWHDRPD